MKVSMLEILTVDSIKYMNESEKFLDSDIGGIGLEKLLWKVFFRFG